jgi:hypothetical protein
MMAIGMLGQRTSCAGTAGTGFFGRSGRFGFRSFDGGVLELPGGTLSLTSKASIRAVNGRSARLRDDCIDEVIPGRIVVNRPVCDRFRRDLPCRWPVYPTRDQTLRK